MKFYCPSCKSKSKQSIMVAIERGAWTGEERIQCPACFLIDYPFRHSPEWERRYGPLVPVKEGA